jgi:putative membrane protein
MAKIENRVIAVLCIFYAVGLLIQVFFPQPGLFKSLTPINIVAGFALAVFFRKKIDLPFISGIIAVAICGFFIEYAGIHTGLIFGKYSYGKTLGPGWQGVPYLIGLNWACLVFFCTSVLAGQFKNPWIVSIVCGLMMVGYDFILEPVAVYFDMWHWFGKPIPIRNYLAWFVASVIFCRLFLSIAKPEKNKVASALFYLQAAFFLLIRLLIL